MVRLVKDSEKMFRIKRIRVNRRKRIERESENKSLT